MKRNSNVPFVSTDKGKWRASLATRILDYESQRFVSEVIIKKHRKSPKWNVRVEIGDEKDFSTEEEARENFESVLLEEGLPLTLIVDGHKIVIAVLKKVNGKYHLEYDKPNEQPELDMREIIFDPQSESARKLIGKYVEVSSSYSFHDFSVMKLEGVSVNEVRPFYGKANDTDDYITGQFIRSYERHRIPLDLSDSSVRDSLRGRWIRNTETGQETMVGNFRFDNGQYKVNGIDANTLLSNWILIDGGLLGVEM